MWRIVSLGTSGRPGCVLSLVCYDTPIGSIFSLDFTPVVCSLARLGLLGYMHKSNKALLILPYFGALGRWFPLFLASVGRQQRIDLLLITNARIPRHVPGNVTVLETTLCNFKHQAIDALNVNVALDHPYKLCDLRPSLGLIFQNNIMGYGYWAFGDEDLIFGDLDGFIGPKMDDAYDVITSYPESEYVSGPLTLIRNTERGANLFKEGTHWAECISASKHWGFDEISWFRDHNDNHRDMSFDGAVRRSMALGLRVSWGLPTDHSCIHRRKGKYVYNNGVLSQVGPQIVSSLAFYHWHRMKRPVFFRFPRWSWHEVPQAFGFDFFGFHFATESTLQRIVRRTLFMIPVSLERAFHLILFRRAS